MVRCLPPIAVAVGAAVTGLPDPAADVVVAELAALLVLADVDVAALVALVLAVVAAAVLAALVLVALVLVVEVLVVVEPPGAAAEPQAARKAATADAEHPRAAARRRNVRRFIGSGDACRIVALVSVAITPPPAKQLPLVSMLLGRAACSLLREWPGNPAGGAPMIIAPVNATLTPCSFGTAASV